MTRPKFAVITVVLMGQYASAFLTHLLPDFSYWLVWIGVVCWLPLLFFTASALLRRRWKALAIFCATWAAVLLPLFEFAEPSSWLERQGFRLHASPIEKYLAGCELVEFVENSTKQTVGACDGFWRGNIEYTVFYDTTGQLLLPAAQRTSEWKDAMSRFTSTDILINSEGRANHLAENFYLVGVHLEEMTGSRGASKT